MFCCTKSSPPPTVELVAMATHSAPITQQPTGIEAKAGPAGATAGISLGTPQKTEPPIIQQQPHTSHRHCPECDTLIPILCCFPDREDDSPHVNMQTQEADPPQTEVSSSDGMTDPPNIFERMHTCCKTGHYPCPKTPYEFSLCCCCLSAEFDQRREQEDSLLSIPRSQLSQLTSDQGYQRRMLMKEIHVTENDLYRCTPEWWRNHCHDCFGDS